MQPSSVSAIQMKGLEFIELATPDAAPLALFLESLGFKAVAKHRHKPVILYRMGSINLIVNSAASGAVHDQALERGVSVCAVAIRVKDAQVAYQSLLNAGAWEAETQTGVMELNIPAIEGVGGTQIFLIDRFDARVSIYDIDFIPLDGMEELFSTPAAPDAPSVASLALSVAHGRNQQWSDFYTQLLGFTVSADGTLVSESGLTIQLDDTRLANDADVGDEYYSAITIKVRDQAELASITERGGLTLTTDEATGSLNVQMPSSLSADLAWRFEVAV